MSEYADTIVANPIRRLAGTIRTIEKLSFATPEPVVEAVEAVEICDDIDEFDEDDDVDEIDEIDKIRPLEKISLIGNPQFSISASMPKASNFPGYKMFLAFLFVFQIMGFIASARSATTSENHGLRNMVYLTGQHPLPPTGMPEIQDVTHVALAFMASGLFNGKNEDRVDWPLFTTVEQTRHQFSPLAKILVAIGGWGDTAAFEHGARTTSSRQQFARNVAAMVQATGADGVDVDWEYPGGNGEDYKTVPNSQKEWQIEAYPLLLAEIRRALGPSKVISAAVPGKPGDMLAFTSVTIPRIMAQVDFLNVMTYDLLNRRDTVTKHHSGVANSLEAVDAYIAAGCSPDRINFGLAFYVKYCKTEHKSCLEHVRNTGSALGCPTLLMEDPKTGADLGGAGAFSWHDSVPDDVRDSFTRAKKNGKYDKDEGGYYYWDEKYDLWWTYDTPRAIVQQKFPRVLEARHLGGVFAWGIGEDGPDFKHFGAMTKGWKQAVAKRTEKKRSEL